MSDFMNDGWASYNDWPLDMDGKESGMDITMGSLEIKDKDQIKKLPAGWAIYKDWSKDEMEKGESDGALWAFETPDQLGCSPDHWGWDFLTDDGYWEFKFFTGEE